MQRRSLDRSFPSIRGLIFRDFALAAAALLFSATIVLSQGSGTLLQGITTPIKLDRFPDDPPRCGGPERLRKVLAFAQDNERQFMQGVASGLRLAAEHRGLTFERVLADNDAARMQAQLRSLEADDVGAVVVAPVDPNLIAGTLQTLIRRGSYVGTIVPPPAVSILNAPQYLTGRVLAEEAAAHIRQKLGGKARVVILTHDSLQFLAPRFTAMRDVLGALPGVSIVADISPATVNTEGGRAMMSTILLAHPDVDVVLGADTVVLGALAAVREARKEHPNQFFGGIDGEPEAVAEIKRGGPYKASVALAAPIFGYAMGQHAADWLDGKSIPQAIDILPKALTASTIAAYEKDRADPAKVFGDRNLRDSYLRMYGAICYESRDRYLNFPWSSEAQ